MDLETLAIRFFTQGEDQVRAALQGMSNDTDQLSGKLSGDLSSGWDSVITKVTSLISIWAAADLFKHIIQEAGELAIKLNVMSQSTGIGAEKLAEIGEQAELAFVPTDSLQTAFRRLAMAMSDSSSRGALAMKAMGLDVESFHGDASKAFEAIAGKLSSYRDDLHKSAIITDLFGRGANLAPLLNQFKQTQTEVQALGQTMTAAQQGAMLDMEHSFVRLKIVSDGYTRQIATEAAPALKVLADAFTINIKNGEQFNVVAEVVGGTIRFLATIVLLVKDAFVMLGHQVADTLADIYLFASGVGKAMVDLAHGNFKKAAGDIAQGFTDMNHAIDAQWHDLIKDGTDAANELKNLFGFDTPSAPAPGGVAKPSAPAVKPPKESDPGKLLKDFLEEQKAEVAAMKASYELKNKIEEDSTDATDAKYAKIKAMDEAYLLEVGSIYGFESAEYLDQLKTQEEHHKAYLDAKKKDEEQYLKDILAIQGKLTEDDKTAAMEKAKIAKELSKTLTSAMSSAFADGFKGGNVAGAMQKFADMVLSGLGNLLTQLGEQYISYGGIMDALSDLLYDPYTAGPAALAIGAALIALGAALGSVGHGGAGGGGGGPIGMPSAVHFTGSAISSGGGPNSATTTGSMKGPAAPTNITIIGPNDPVAQRQLTELMMKAAVR